MNPPNHEPAGPEGETRALADSRSDDVFRAEEDPLPSQNPKITPKVPSAEEQMESFEDALKESDWGHQPC